MSPELQDVHKEDYETDQGENDMQPSVAPSNQYQSNQPLKDDAEFNTVEKNGNRKIRQSAGIQDDGSRKRKNKKPLPDNFLDENIADIEGEDPKKRKQRPVRRQRHESYDIAGGEIIQQELPPNRNETAQEVIYQGGRSGLATEQRDYDERTMAPSAMDQEQQRASRMKRSISKQSTVKFGKVNQVIDYDKDGRQIQYTQDTRQSPRTHKPQKMQSQKMPFNTGLGSIDFGGPTTKTKEPPKGEIGYDADGTPNHEDEALKQRFFRQKFLAAMTTEQYTYQTNPGKQANQINDEMMRAILDKKDSARTELNNVERLAQEKAEKAQKE